jgi:hypothetical protein
MGDSSGCSCTTWSLAHVDAEHEIRLVQALEHERNEYREIVQHWNEQVQKAGDSRQFSYMEFCDYIVNIYAERYKKCYESDRI